VNIRGRIKTIFSTGKSIPHLAQSLAGFWVSSETSAILTNWLVCGLFSFFYDWWVVVFERLFLM
jgi:hypothetical protein